MLTPHHGTLLVHCEPLSVVTHVKHMSAELTYHEQALKRLVTNRTERESLCLHALRRAGRALCCRLRPASLPVGRGVLVLSTAVARRALIARSGGRGLRQRGRVKTQLGGVQHILQEFHFPLVKPPLVENRRHHHQHVVRVDAPTELHELQHVHAHGAAEHATVGDQERQRQEVALLHHAVPAAIEEAADEEDGAVAGLGGCVCEERVEEFEQDDAAVHVEG